MTLLGNVFELGFNGISARLPEGGYGTFNALFNVFFIMIAPLTSVQLVVGKEVAAYNTLGELGKLRTFVRRSALWVMAVTLALSGVGIAASPLIAGFMRIDSVLPVVLLMAVVTIYAPYPLLFGTIQGLKKFLVMGCAQFGWGFFRFSAAAIAVLALSCGVTGMLVGVICAVAVLTMFAALPVRDVLVRPGDPVDRSEFAAAYRMAFPIMGAIVCVSILKNIDLVFARRFFDDAALNAYTCAARVGSGFFTLTGVAMVMFPHVSEEKTLSRNPVVFLVKSCAVTVGLSAAGMIVAWFAPGFVMRVITLGKVIPGAEPLIRFVGFAIIPVSLASIMSHYLLAKHEAGFVPFLAVGACVQIALIAFMHRTPMMLLAAVGSANILACAALAVYVWNEHRRYIRGAA